MRSDLEDQRTFIELITHDTSVKRDDFLIEPLNSAAVMVEEAFAMRHCVAKYINDCREGKLRFFSVRERGSAKRLATLSITLAADGFWRVHEIAGFANGPVGKKLQQLGQEVARQTNYPGEKSRERSPKHFPGGSVLNG